MSDVLELKWLESLIVLVHRIELEFFIQLLNITIHTNYWCLVFRWPLIKFLFYDLGLWSLKLIMIYLTSFGTTGLNWPFNQYHRLQKTTKTQKNPRKHRISLVLTLDIGIVSYPSKQTLCVCLSKSDLVLVYCSPPVHYAEHCWSKSCSTAYKHKNQSKSERWSETIGRMRLFDLERLIL